jgi:hypothetical protein
MASPVRRPEQCLSRCGVRFGHAEKHPQTHPGFSPWGCELRHPRSAFFAADLRRYHQFTGKAKLR